MIDDASAPARDLGEDPDRDLGLELQRALAAMGMACDVEVDGRLALLVRARTPDAPVQWDRLQEPALRRELAALAAAHGFSHVAVELEADGAPGYDADLRVG